MNTTERAPAPSNRTYFPWRFVLGQQIYLSQQLSPEPVCVVGGELWMGWPHLHVEDSNGEIWRVPQLHAMSKPLSAKLR